MLQVATNLDCLETRLDSLLMSQENSRKKLKFDEQSSPVKEGFSIALCTKLILGEDINDFYFKLSPIFNDLLVNSNEEIASLIEDTLGDKKYAENCKNRGVNAGIEMLEIETPRILQNIEDIAFNLFVAKYNLCSNSVDNNNISDIDKEIEDSLIQFEGLVTAKKMLEQKSEELQKTRESLEHLLKECQMKNQVNQAT